MAITEEVEGCMKQICEIVRTIKSATARHIFAEHPEVKKLWGGEFWSDGYYIATARA